MRMEKLFDKQSLTENDGQEGRSTYVARDGVVYDVSDSKLWKDGQHMKRHQAGQDLSAEFSAAPHGPEVLERFPRIGTLEGAIPAITTEFQQIPLWLGGLLKQYPLLARHPHPAMVHFPIAFLFAVPIFSLLALLTGHGSFEATAFHCLGGAILITPLTIGSGFFTWWLNYESQLIHQIRIKIIGSVLLMAEIIVLFVWRYMEPEIVFTPGIPRLIYLLLLLSLFPLVGIIGWNGAALTFPHTKK